jgi:endonuclease III
MHGGEVPRDREALEALPGVGRKTANVVCPECAIRDLCEFEPKTPAPKKKLPRPKVFS